VRELLDPRLLARPTVLIGLVIVTILLVCALGAPWIAPYDPFASRPAEQFLPPVWADGGTTDHLLGTDQLGRDLASRMLYGARTSLAIAGAAVVLSGAFGAVVGLFAGYFRGPVETVIMRLADVQLAFPFILLALAILSVTETKNVLTMITVLAIADWVIHARVSRGRVLVERERDYVRAARALGSSHLRIAFRYILPTVLPTLLVIVLVEMGGADGGRGDPGIHRSRHRSARPLMGNNHGRRPDEHRSRAMDGDASWNGHLPLRARR
jgi:peptide/nickel transport system permease protein